MIIVSAKLALTTERKRCGVIPYTIRNGVVYFLCAIDRKTGEYSDFGGGVKRTETAIEGGIREFREESMGIFEEDLYSANTYSSTIAIDNVEKEMSIMFLPLHETWFSKCIQLFDRAKKGATSREEILEVSDIVWLDESRFFEVSLSRTYKGARRMWLRLKSFFYRTIGTKDQYNEFVELLRVLYIHRFKVSGYGA